MMLSIKIVCVPCPTCTELERRCKNTLKEMKINVRIDRVSDPQRFTELGIHFTPGLIVNNDVLSVGRLPKAKALEKLLKSAIHG